MTTEAGKAEALFACRCNAVSWAKFPCSCRATQEDILCDFCRTNCHGPADTLLLAPLDGHPNEVLVKGAVKSAFESSSSVSVSSKEPPNQGAEQ